MYLSLARNEGYQCLYWQEGEPKQVRPYTPVSDNSMLGKFELLIKRYPAWGDPSFAHNYKPPGKMSTYVHDLEV